MAFCSFSKIDEEKTSTLLDNQFIFEYMPESPSICAKVYILGLSLCQNPNNPNNNIKYFANILNVCEDDIISAFMYWQELGLVEVLNISPVEIRFLPMNKDKIKMRTYNPSVYKDFNIQMQEIISKRQLTPTELDEYYRIIEDYHLTQEALIMIAKYCADLKGENVSRSYISTVAKNWAKEGILNFEDVEKKIESLGILDDNLNLLFNALGIKRNATIDDREYLNKWIKTLGFDMSVILHIPKTIRIRKRLDLIDLDNQLMKYYEMKLFSIKEIDDYEKNKSDLFNTAKQVVKSLGLYYDDLSKVVDTYIIPFINMGYDEITLTQMADYCFKHSIRTLDSFNAFVGKMYSLGITNVISFAEYLENIAVYDTKIKEILFNLNILRNVNNYDRAMYKTWISDWNFDDELISYATSLSAGTQNPMQYMNKLLSNWYTLKINTIEKAKANSQTVKNAPNTQKDKLNESYKQTNFSKEFLDSLITNLDEVDV